MSPKPVPAKATTTTFLNIHMKKFLLAIVALGSSAIASAQCTELFFSEIVEGSGNNKAIEVYNPTSSPVSLSNYRIVRYSNGSTTGTDSLQLSGTIAAHDVWVVANGQTTSSTNSPACDTALQNMADQLGGVYPDPLYENGDDAICLVRVFPYAIVDIFGKIGEQPATAWSDVYPYNGTVGTWITKDHTMIRKSSVVSGVTSNPTVFNVMAEYDTLPKDTWTNLGIHNSTCNTSGIFEGVVKSGKVTVFPNPSNGLVTLTASTAIAGVEIYNSLGELVENRFFTPGQTQQIDLSGNKPGLYIIRARLANGQQTVSKVSIN
jgi:hypothetical protein